ncbi:MAG: NPCBM/NEW2 domain-containing protein, partial [Planctomycetota bacterium]
MVGAALLWAAVGSWAGSDRLVLLDGTAASDAVTSIDEQGLVHRKSGKPPIDLMGLRRIERPVKADKQKPSPRDVHLLTDGVIRARTVRFADGRFTVGWAYGKKTVLPLPTVRAVRVGTVPETEDGAEAPLFAQARQAAETRRDELFALVDNKLQVVRGGLVRITGKEVFFHWSGEERKVARGKVYGIVLAHIGARPDLAGQCFVQLRDGSSLWGRVTKLERGRLHLELAADAALTLPWSAVCRLDVRSTRMAFLSDLDPVAVSEEALVTYAGPWRRDRNAVGGPLKLGKTIYQKGLGVHARCRLTYDLGGRYQVFAAVLGLDASTEGKGNCIFIVDADGRELLRKRLRGSDPPLPVRLRIAGARELTLT